MGLLYIFLFSKGLNLKPLKLLKNFQDFFLFLHIVVGKMTKMYQQSYRVRHSLRLLKILSRRKQPNTLYSISSPATLCTFFFH